MRFISDSGHGWLEVPTVDVITAGVAPSRYSYLDAATGMSYLEEDCDASAYLHAVGCTKGLTCEDCIAPIQADIYIDGDCWVRGLPRYA